MRDLNEVPMFEELGYEEIAPNIVRPQGTRGSGVLLADKTWALLRANLRTARGEVLNEQA